MREQDERDVNLPGNVFHEDSELSMVEMLWGEAPVSRWFKEYVNGMCLEIVAEWDRQTLGMVLENLENANAVDGLEYGCFEYFVARVEKKIRTCTEN
ncbi:unnamed protein product [Callosobruchus maculatus]|nr:unnamed protein product [Callosobruchus maculatus]